LVFAGLKLIYKMFLFLQVQDTFC